MITTTYCSSGFLLALTALLFQLESLTLTYQCILWFIVFAISSPGASAAPLTVSELFPLVKIINLFKEIRSQSLALFFAIGLGFGGIIAPSIFGFLINTGTRANIALGYYFSSALMLFGGVVAHYYCVDAEM